MHPFEFAAQEVAYLVGLCVVVGDALRAFLQIVLVVALVDIDLAVVEFHDDVAHAVEEVTVVGYHEEGAAGAAEIILEVFDGVNVEVVGGLVEDQEIGFCGQYLRDGHAFDLSAGEFFHLLLGTQSEFGEDADDAVLVFEAAFRVERREERRAAGKHLFEQRGFRVEVIVLLEESDPDFLEELDLPAGIGFVLAGQDAHERGLAGAVGGDQGNLVAFVHIEADMVEQHFRPVGLGDVLDLQVGSHDATKIGKTTIGSFDRYLRNFAPARRVVR